jgi:tetratricopeptide (TPR) repeat protein
MILNEDPVEPRKLRQNVPAELSIICMKAMEKRRGDRYATMAELAADLRRYLGNEPILARAPGSARRLQKWILRHPTRSAALGIGTTALIIVMVLLVRTLKAEQDARQSAQLAQEREQVAVQAQIRESEERARAEREKQAATQARNEALDAKSEADAARAETEIVADFQSRMLRELDARGMGIRLLADLTRTDPLVSDRRVDALHGLGEALAKAGDHDGGEQAFREGLDLATRQENDLSLAYGLGGLAEVLHRASRFEEAKELFRQGIELFDGIPEMKPEVEAVFRVNLALMLHDLEEFDEVEQLLRGALVDLRAAHGNEHLEVATALANLGMTLMSKGAANEAERCLREALPMHRGCWAAITRESGRRKQPGTHAPDAGEIRRRPSLLSGGVPHHRPRPRHHRVQPGAVPPESRSILHGPQQVPGSPGLPGRRCFERP